MDNVINLEAHKSKKNNTPDYNPANIMLCFSESQLIEMINTFIAHAGEKYRDVIVEYKHLFYVGYLDEKEDLINPTSDFAK